MSSSYLTILSIIPDLGKLDDNYNQAIYLSLCNKMSERDAYHSERQNFMLSLSYWHQIDKDIMV